MIIIGKRTDDGTNAEVEIDDRSVIEYICAQFYPEEVFSAKELEEWAEESGYEREF
jgi:hypothetical protein